MFYNTGNGQDGTASDDVIVTYESNSHVSDGVFGAQIESIKLSALGEVRKASGINGAQIQQTSEVKNQKKNRYFSCEFTLYKEGCCGKTGRGGPGKIFFN